MGRRLQDRPPDRQTPPPSLRTCGRRLRLLQAHQRFFAWLSALACSACSQSLFCLEVDFEFLLTGCETCRRPGCMPKYQQLPARNLPIPQTSQLNLRAPRIRNPGRGQIQRRRHERTLRVRTERSLIAQRLSGLRPLRRGQQHEVTRRSHAQRYRDHLCIAALFTTSTVTLVAPEAPPTLVQ